MKAPDTNTTPDLSLPHYHVTAGIIFRKGRILISRRFPQGVTGGLWEFPGGKQEQGESLEECLIREIREELDVQIQVCRLLASVDHTYPGFRITLHTFICRYLSGEPKALKVAEFRWVGLDEIHDYQFPPADLKVLKLLKEGSLESRTC